MGATRRRRRLRATPTANPSVGWASFGGVSGPGDVPVEILDRLRPVCLGLPETYEQSAWVGTRWRIRQRTFAHVFTLDPEDERVFARAAAVDQPACGLTFRATADEIDALVSGGSPYYKPTWAPDVVGMLLDDRTDWDEVGELLTESYCMLAPGKLATRVIRPSGHILVHGGGSDPGTGPMTALHNNPEAANSSSGRSRRARRPGPPRPRPATPAAPRSPPRSPPTAAGSSTTAPPANQDAAAGSHPWPASRACSHTTGRSRHPTAQNPYP